MKLMFPAFLRNSVTLAAAQIISQLIFVVFTPILTRIYGPELFGVAVTVYSIAVTVGIIASFRLDLAVVLSPDDQSTQIYLSGATVALTISSVLFLAVFAFRPSAPDFIQTNPIFQHAVLIPIISFAYAMQILSLALGNRYRRYPAMATALVFGTLTMVIYATSVGPYDGSGNGLLTGRALGVFVVSIILVALVGRGLSMPAIRPSKIVETVRQNKRYPLLNVPYSCMEALGTESFPILAISMARTELAGFYALIRVALVLPVSVASAAMGQVFFRDAVDRFGTVELENRTVLIWKVVATALAPFLVVIPFFGTYLFALVFGSSWSEAGRLAALYAPAALMIALSGFPARLYEIAFRQDISLKLAIWYSITKSGIVYLMIKNNCSNEHIVLTNAVVDFGYHALFVIFICRISGFSVAKLLSGVVAPVLLTGSAGTLASLACFIVFGASLMGAAAALAVACVIGSTSLYLTARPLLAGR